MESATGTGTGRGGRVVPRGLEAGAGGWRMVLALRMAWLSPYRLPGGLGSKISPLETAESTRSDLVPVALEPSTTSTHRALQACPSRPRAPALTWPSTPRESSSTSIMDLPLHVHHQLCNSARSSSLAAREWLPVRQHRHSDDGDLSRGPSIDNADEEQDKA